ncbi:MAG: hypothetical protein WBA16_03500 [Nonlabens sp.]
MKSIFHEGKQIVEGLHWVNTIPDRVEINTARLHQHAGVYKTDLGFEIEFTVTENGLMTKSDVFPKIRLWPKSENDFSHCLLSCMSIFK